MVRLKPGREEGNEIRTQSLTNTDQEYKFENCPVEVPGSVIVPNFSFLLQSIIRYKENIVSQKRMTFTSPFRILDLSKLGIILGIPE